MRIHHLCLFISLGLVAGCVTVSGNYRVSAVGAGGEKLADNILAQGRGIYAVRNAICSQYPRATVLISDAQTGQPLSGESPYQCR